MASIDQYPGALDFTSMIQGEAVASQTIHDVDITAGTSPLVIFGIEWEEVNQ